MTGFLPTVVSLLIWNVRWSSWRSETINTRRTTNLWPLVPYEGDLFLMIESSQRPAISIFVHETCFGLLSVQDSQASPDTERLAKRLKHSLSNEYVWKLRRRENLNIFCKLKNCQRFFSEMLILHAYWAERLRSHRPLLLDSAFKPVADKLNTTREDAGMQCRWAIAWRRSSVCEWLEALWYNSMIWWSLIIYIAADLCPFFRLGLDLRLPAYKSR